MKSMKNIARIMIISLLFFIHINSNAQNWQWAKHFGGVSVDGANSMCTDPSGNIYLTGRFNTPKAFFGADTLITNGNSDVMIVKMDSNGNFIWAKRAGGYSTMDNESGNNIIYESSTNTIILTGVMNSTGETMGTCNLGSGSVIFLSKLDLNGNCIWSITEPLNGGFPVCSISTDNLGNIYMDGYYSLAGTFNGTFLQNGSFLAKFNTTNGGCEWVKNVTNIHVGLDNIIYNNNYLYIGGSANNTLTIDTLNLDTAIVYCHKDDIYLSKWDTAGNVIWVKTMGGPNTDFGGWTGMDGDNNLYLAGCFKDTSYFGTTILVDGLHQDGFLAKYTNTGHLTWVRQITTTSFVYIDHVSTDNVGNTYVIGTFADTAHFGTYTVVASSAQDMFVARYDSSGVCLGVKTVANVTPWDILTNSGGSFYVCGSFNSSANFDGNNITTYGSYDGFIAKSEAIIGIKEKTLNSNNNSLVIYANPNRGTCNIKVPPDLLHEQNLVLNIYDSNGKLIQQQPVQVDQEKVKINIEAEATGIYNVTLGNKNKVYSGKIVFE